MLNVEVGAMMDSESRILLKTTPSAPARGGLGATLGATRMNNLGMLRTRLDNRESRT
jgi:hypothetical protein